ncbi:universal stress protein [Natronococcus occultus]|uniref:Universal stress protein UspA-like protein n=1 Tax=Natronococcus occultus SP4 TaxID=694430 RepID=L0K261_9EURY|nr:universal stress protein [Natronococcus occultus]AGB39377.1 universal stress protein UspA-like protein [Natronococcus occultus SP4]
MSPSDDSPAPIRSILAPTDGSDAATAALERALELAASLEATVHVLSVVDTTSNPMQFGVSEVADLDRTATELVEDVADACDDGPIPAIEGAVRRGRPAPTILDYAAENGIDLLVVGRTGRGVVAKTLLGSTADRLVRQAPIPVVVVPDGGAE